jgi:Tfp pilus assembly protein PilF
MGRSVGPDRSLREMKLNLIPTVFVFCVVSAGAAFAGGEAESDVAYNVALNYLKTGQGQLAVEQFKKAVALDDKNYSAYKGLGIAFTQQKNYKEAEKALRKCLEVNPDFADAHNDLGVALMLQGRREDARKEWLAAMASPFDPTPDQTAWNLANSYLDESRYAEAARWFQQSLAHNQESVPARVGLASAFLAQNKLDDAINVLETSKAKNTDPVLMVNLGNAYFQAGRFVEARALLETVIKKDSSGVAGKRASELLKNFPK